MPQLLKTWSFQGHVQVTQKDRRSVRKEPDVTEYDSDGCFLGAVGTGRNNSWQVTLQLNDNPTEFQIDTGAEASIISERIYQKIGSPLLSQVTQTFKGPRSEYPSHYGMIHRKAQEGQCRGRTRDFRNQRNTQTPTRTACN